jgi:hypothetical protein
MGITMTNSISQRIKLAVRLIRPQLYDTLENAVVGCSTEIIYLNKLTLGLAQLFNTLHVPGFAYSARHAVIHQKPKVFFNNVSCELADLLVVVK